MGKIILVLVTVIVVLVILAFTGVQPFSNFKDSVISNIGDIFEGNKTPSETSGTLAEGKNVKSDDTTTDNGQTTPLEDGSPFVARYLTDTELKYIKDGTAIRCKLLVYLDATKATKPGYYTLTLKSTYNDFDEKEIIYHRGDIITPLSWTIAGGDTWVALTKMESLESLISLFSCNYSYSPFVTSTPVIPGTPPTDVENALYRLINEYRAKIGVATLTWNQNIQDASRNKAMAMLIEGVAGYLPLEPSYTNQLIFSGHTFSSETSDQIAKKAFDSWLTVNSDRQTMISEEYTTMAIGYVVESKESIYYIELLFSGE